MLPVTEQVDPDFRSATEAEQVAEVTVGVISTCNQTHDGRNHRERAQENVAETVCSKLELEDEYVQQ